ncbi:hypothetical protein BLNAU_15480 [Blattamonas nauphoetae]|uniref:Uncharacterized protein n=1 Tax=Blattamonas nauphoetae TaxID=2049346 RepID=A0ABQ9XEI1_9EUKA|nr:hypothetical protein BLNAU_15480 [Blattamonas nauphoetae]
MVYSTITNIKVFGETQLGQFMSEQYDHEHENDDSEQNSQILLDDTTSGDDPPEELEHPIVPEVSPQQDSQNESVPSTEHHEESSLFTEGLKENDAEETEDPNRKETGPISEATSFDRERKSNPEPQKSSEEGREQIGEIPMNEQEHVDALQQLDGEEEADGREPHNNVDVDDSDREEREEAHENKQIERNESEEEAPVMNKPFFRRMGKDKHTPETSDQLERNDSGQMDDLRESPEKKEDENNTAIRLDDEQKTEEKPHWDFSFLNRTENKIRSMFEKDKKEPPRKDAETSAEVGDTSSQQEEDVLTNQTSHEGNEQTLPSSSQAGTNSTLPENTTLKQSGVDPERNGADQKVEDISMDSLEKTDTSTNTTLTDEKQQIAELHSPQPETQDTQSRLSRETGHSDYTLNSTVTKQQSTNNTSSPSQIENDKGEGTSIQTESPERTPKLNNHTKPSNDTLVSGNNTTAAQTRLSTSNTSQFTDTPSPHSNQQNIKSSSPAAKHSSTPSQTDPQPNATSPHISAKSSVFSVMSDQLRQLGLNLKEVNQSLEHLEGQIRRVSEMGAEEARVRQGNVEDISNSVRQMQMVFKETTSHLMERVSDLEKQFAALEAMKDTTSAGLKAIHSLTITVGVHSAVIGIVMIVMCYLIVTTKREALPANLSHDSQRKQSQSDGKKEK